MKNTTLLIALLAAVIGFSFVWQTTPQQSSAAGHRPTSKVEELRSEGFHFPGEVAAGNHGRNTAALMKKNRVSLPYVLDVTAMEKPLHKLRTADDKAITELVNEQVGRFSRAPMLSYEYVATVGSTDKYRSIIYRTANGYGDDIYPVYYTLCTISGDGDLISRMRIASLNSYLDVRTAVISPDGAVHSKSLKQTWESDPLVKGYKDNKVISSEVTAEQSYKADADGKITEVKASAAGEARN